MKPNNDTLLDEVLHEVQELKAPVVDITDDVMSAIANKQLLVPAPRKKKFLGYGAAVAAACVLCLFVIDIIKYTTYDFNENVVGVMVSEVYIEGLDDEEEYIDCEEALGFDVVSME